MRSDDYTARMSTWDSIYRYPEGSHITKLYHLGSTKYFQGIPFLLSHVESIEMWKLPIKKFEIFDDISQSTLFFVFLLYLSNFDSRIDSLEFIKYKFCICLICMRFWAKLLKIGSKKVNRCPLKSLSGKSHSFLEFNILQKPLVVRKGFRNTDILLIYSYKS